jgi:hypothetical protein
MSRTQRFRDQHQELIKTADLLCGDLDLPGVPSEKLRSTLSELTGRLRVHLAMEDTFYPKMSHSADEELSALAIVFRDEMELLRASYERYNAEWTVTKIATKREAFAAATREMMEALSSRLVREDEELYEKADRAEDISQVTTLPRR